MDVNLSELTARAGTDAGPLLRGLRGLAAAGTTLSLAACGGGGSSGSAEANPPPAAMLRMRRWPVRPKC